MKMLNKILVGVVLVATATMVAPDPTNWKMHELMLATDVTLNGKFYRKEPGFVNRWKLEHVNGMWIEELEDTEIRRIIKVM